VAYPDSTEPGINNNAYTNLLAVWVLSRAIELLQILPEDHCDELCEKLYISKDEVSNWDKISRQMFVPFMENGIISQYEGYDKLEEFPGLKNGRLDQAALKKALDDNGGILNKYKVCKQPDTLMLFYLFSSEELKELFERCGYEFTSETIGKTIEYYAVRTSNASTLSRVAMTWVLSRADRANCLPLLSSISKGSTNGSPNTEKAVKNNPRLATYLQTWNVFRQALNSDYKDIQGGTTREGIHIGAMAGTIDIVQRAYTGIVTKEDTLWLKPRLPKEMTRLSFRLQYRQQSLLIEISQSTCTVTAGHASVLPVSIGFKDKKYELKAGERKRFELETGKEQAIQQAA
jgi:alpha,alpha-trehalase